MNWFCVRMHFDYLSSWASTSPLNKEKLRKNNLIGIKIGEVRWKQKCLIWFWWTLRSTNLKKKMLYVHHIQYLYLHHLFWTSSNYPIPKKKIGTFVPEFMKINKCNFIHIDEQIKKTYYVGKFQNKFHFAQKRQDNRIN